MYSLTAAFPKFSGKTAIVRANFDVPLENGVVGDTTRIEDVVNTLKLLRANNCQIVILAHAGRPDGKYVAEDSLAPIIPILENLVNQPIALATYQPNFRQVQIPTSSPIVLLDNLRFWAEEESNDPAFSLWLTTLGDFYVNEAFAVCHRKHASMVGIPKYRPSFAGLSLNKEIEVLTKIKNHPDHPLVVVLGGAKLETKLPLITAFAPIADTILVGGKLIAESQGKSLPANVKLGELNSSSRDITEASAREFAQIISQAATVVWNGTMGVFEEADNKLGTQIVAQAINDTPAFTLMGGGDTETAATIFNCESGLDHISTGGGAMLTFLVDGQLVAVEALN
jgi:phosphoglycerate kinase